MVLVSPTPSLRLRYLVTSSSSRERNYPGNFSPLVKIYSGTHAIESQNDRAIHACDQIRDTVSKLYLVTDTDRDRVSASVSGYKLYSIPTSL